MANLNIVVPDISNILDNIHKQQEQKTINSVTTKETNNNNNKKKNIKSQKIEIPRGISKSGRPWKEPKKRFSGIKKSIYRRTPTKKEEYRQELKHIKDLSRSIKEDHKVENERKRLRREENAKKKLENERKSEIVQIIKNPAKIKRMKKKALRKIEKRDLSKIKVV